RLPGRVQHRATARGDRLEPAPGGPPGPGRPADPQLSRDPEPASSLTRDTAALPGRSGQVRRDSLDQTLVGVGGDEADAGQAAGDEVGEELVPGRGGLAGRDA